MPLDLARPVGAAGLLLFAWVWPAEEEAVPAGRKAALLAQCRDALEERAGLELDADVTELPNVVPQPGDRFVLTATVQVDGRPQSFRCEVLSTPAATEVTRIHLLDF